MLSKLFRSRARFDDPDAENRRRAVLALSDEETESFQSDLAELARTDPDRAVRRAALGRVTDVAQLESFLGNEDADLARVAAEGVAALGQDPARFGRPEIRNAAIRASRDPEAVLGLIGDLGFDSELVTLAVEARHPKVRLAIADKLMRESSLIELERASRDRDKNVNRLARSRLDAIKHARADVEKTSRRADELGRSLAALAAAAEHDPLFLARLGVIRQDWQSNLAKHDQAAAILAGHGVTTESIEPQQQAFEAADAAARSVAASIASAAKAAHATPPVAAASIAVDDAFGQSLRTLDSLLADVASAARDAIAEYDAIHAESIEAQDHWLAAADHQPPPEALAARFHTVTHALKLVFEAVLRARDHAAEIASLTGPAPDLPADPHGASAPEDFERFWNEQRQARIRTERITRLLSRIAWPTDCTLPRQLEELIHCRTALAEFDARIHALHDALASRLSALLERLGAEIGAGNLSSATGLEAEGRRLLKCLPPGTAKRLSNEFNALSVQVLEFKDWVTYATHPKREEYVAEMEALAAAPLAAPAQAERIKSLREAWKALGPITHQPDRRLFDRFNAAAERAFEPCRAYFEAQSERRRFNLEQRRKICDDLSLYLDNTDWAQADWRAAEKILQVARDEWRKFHPVDRSPGRKLDSRFEELTGRLHEQIKGEWDRNVALKQAIVAEAASVRDAASGAGDTPALDLRAATDRIKSLQQRWREVGIMPRRVDQRLWRDFRAICDEVFGRRDAVRTERREAIVSHASQAEHLLDEYQHQLDLAHEAGADPAVARDFGVRFHEIHDLPRDVQRRLEGRFRDIDKNYRVLLRQMERRRLTGGVDRLETLDNAITHIELDVFDGVIDTTQLDDRLSAVPGFDPKAPGPFAGRLEALRRGQRGAKDVMAARRALTVEMEIVAGLDTPAEDQRLRLAQQVERLNQKHRKVLDEDPMHLAQRWCALGPLDQDDADLRDRFFQACREAFR